MAAIFSKLNFLTLGSWSASSTGVRYSAWREKKGYSSSFQVAPATPSAAQVASHRPAGEASTIGDLKLSQCVTTMRNSGPDSLCHQRHVPYGILRLSASITIRTSVT